MPVVRCGFLHPLVCFPSLLTTFLVDVVRSIGGLPVGLSPGGDALVHGIGMIATAALGQVRFSVQDIDGVVVRRVLLGGVVADSRLLDGSWSRANFRVRMLMEVLSVSVLGFVL